MKQAAYQRQVQCRIKLIADLEAIATPDPCSTRGLFGVGRLVMEIILVVKL